MSGWHYSHGPRTRKPRWDYAAITQIPYDSSNPWLPKSFDRRASAAFFKASNQSIVPAAGPRSLCNRTKTKVGPVRHSASRCVALLASRNTTQGKSKTAKDQCGHERVASDLSLSITLVKTILLRFNCARRPRAVSSPGSPKTLGRFRNARPTKSQILKAFAMQLW